MRPTVQEQETDECTSGLVGYESDWLEFVHGTAIEIFDAAPGIQANGGGDYGAGFYTFLACGQHAKWGCESAAEWARLKASASLPGIRRTPCLVYVRIKPADFAALTCLKFDRVTSIEAFGRFGRREVTGYQLIYGPTASRRKGPPKQWEPQLPCQFKFEASSCGQLELSRIETNLDCV